MLTELSVKNHTLVDSLEIDLSEGLTAITGETGTGKSILLSALGLTLGDRADFDQVRKGAQRAEIQARFELQDLPSAMDFLKHNDLDEGEECLLRRVVNANGNSRAWINGQQVTLSVLRDLAEQLISIHSQHEHQCLLKPDYQQQILDGFGNLDDELKAVQHTFNEWNEKKLQLESLRENLDEYIQRKELLAYQVKELDDLQLNEGEFEALESEHKQLSNAEQIIKTLYQAQAILSEDESFNLINGMNQLQSLTQEIDIDSALLAETNELITSSFTQLQEARDSLRRTADSVQLDPERLLEVDERLSAAFDLSRKHRCEPGQLPERHHNLSQELLQLSVSGTDTDKLEEEVEQLKSLYDQAAQKLSEKRSEAASTLANTVQEHFSELNMSGASLLIELVPSKESEKGNERCEFLIQTNPGQQHKPLSRIASGGELSRVSLAIQVVTAQTNTSPTLVFDEVDSGIGGATANVVGRKLRELGKSTQVICVTHLAQVASKANQQLNVIKQTGESETRTVIHALDEESRRTEIARMLSGDTDSKHSLKHAEELLKAAQA